MFGFWIRPDRYINFQHYYTVFLNQLKMFAYRLEDILSGQTARYHTDNVTGYVIKVGDYTKIFPYLTTLALPTVQNLYDQTIGVTGTVAANLVPGSVIFWTEGSYGIIVDDGNGNLKAVDRIIKAGTIDYTTGTYTFTIPVDDFGKVNVGYAVEGTNVTFTDISAKVGASAGKVKAIIGGKIYQSAASYKTLIMAVEGSDKMFVGFAVNDDNLKEIADYIGAAAANALAVDPTTLTAAAGDTVTATISGGIGTVTATTEDTELTVTVTGTQISIVVADDATAGDYTVTVTDSATVPNEVEITVTVS